MPHANDMKKCIETCWSCRDMCQRTLYTYCLPAGGTHVAEDHVKIMIDCIAICQTAADFMTRQSPHHVLTCGACAEICAACADSCTGMDDEMMKQCADLCRQCAEMCRSMSAGAPQRRSAA